MIGRENIFTIVLDEKYFNDMESLIQTQMKTEIIFRGLPFSITDEVYVITDPEQLVNIVTGILVRDGYIQYELSFMGKCSLYDVCEISNEINPKYL